MKFKFLITIFLFSILLSWQSLSYAVLDLELTKGIDTAIPIAIVPFGFQGSVKPPIGIVQIIRRDLQNSGYFKMLSPQDIKQFPHHVKQVDYKYWQQRKIDNLVIGNIQYQSKHHYQIDFDLLDIYNRNRFLKQYKSTEIVNTAINPVLIHQSYVARGKNLRRLGHKIADAIYQKLIGVPGIFSTKIAYVVVKRHKGSPTKYLLEIADSDGYHPQPILISTEPIMSPAWSPDGKKIAYVSFENRRASIYVSDIATGKRRLITQFPQINGAPAWSPDGRKLAIVLSKGGSPEIFSVDVASGKLVQLTHDWAIDTEPAWSPDGKAIIFTSDRGGSPQIYEKNLLTGKVQRMTYSGRYNARASFTSDGKSIVMLHLDETGFNIAIQDLESGDVSVLTHANNDQSPSLAPNGKMVIYSTQYNGHNVLSLVSTDGRVRLRIPESEGEVKDPIWSPFLQN